ncbi:hypothetical protein P8452_47552 [Trifolium repens]|nr:hypothetical protein P8452_47552 [Trifolium repens]
MEAFLPLRVVILFGVEIEKFEGRFRVLFGFGAVALVSMLRGCLGTAASADNETSTRNKNKPLREAAQHDDIIDLTDADC